MFFKYRVDVQYANYSSEMALEIYNGRLPIVLID